MVRNRLKKVRLIFGEITYRYFSDNQRVHVWLN